MPSRVTIDNFGPDKQALLQSAWVDTTLTLDQIAEMLSISRDQVRARARMLDLPHRGQVAGRWRKKTYPCPFIDRPKPAPELPVASPTQWDDGWSIKQPTKEQLMGGSTHVRQNTYYRSTP